MAFKDHGKHFRGQKYTENSYHHFEIFTTTGNHIDRTSVNVGSWPRFSLLVECYIVFMLPYIYRMYLGVSLLFYDKSTLDYTIALQHYRSIGSDTFLTAIGAVILYLGAIRFVRISY